MNWLDRDGSSVSGGYRISRLAHGYSAWLFSRKQSGCLGRRIATLDAAKKLCEQHKSKEAA